MSHLFVATYLRNISKNQKLRNKGLWAVEVVVRKSMYFTYKTIPQAFIQSLLILAHSKQKYSTEGKVGLLNTASAWKPVRRKCFIKYRLPLWLWCS